jgi:hypothetical protein
MPSDQPAVAGTMYSRISITGTALSGRESLNAAAKIWEVVHTCRPQRHAGIVQRAIPHAFEPFKGREQIISYVINIL